MSDHKVLIGDTLEVLKTLPADFFDTVVTSPPYWGLRDYKVPGQIGHEPSPDAFVARLADVFDEVRRVLRPDGTLWVNIGDSYFSQGGAGTQGKGGQRASRTFTAEGLSKVRPKAVEGLKNKDLVGIPWLLAFELRRRGWWLRQDIIWAKPNPMPESVRDRCTRSHEHIFMLAKSEKYHYDRKAIEEDGVYPAGTKGGKASAARAAETGVNSRPAEYKVYSGKRNKRDVWAAEPEGSGIRFGGNKGAGGDNATYSGKEWVPTGKRNKRDVWPVPTACFKGAHFATFPVKLIEPCILAGSRPGGHILDPFCGTGTVGEACERHGRVFTGIDLDPRAEGWLADRLAKAVRT